jgi:DnaJ-class molecular chaperone
MFFKKGNAKGVCMKEKTDAPSNGDARPVCPACLGTKVRMYERGDEVCVGDCDVCKERGVVPAEESCSCPRCGGTGTSVSTDVCLCTGWRSESTANCARCGGTGEISPATPEGYVACAECKGTGEYQSAVMKRDCARCKGRGVRSCEEQAFQERWSSLPG